MKGKYRVVVENKRIRYDFEIKRNLTIIKGDSATGKTTLVSMVSEYYENGEASGITLQCDRECAVLEGRGWKTALSAFSNFILFIDEGNPFVRTTEFASEIQKTNNYYVIVTREALPALPYSVTEIYGIRDSGKYGSLKQTYNELYRIYGDIKGSKKIYPNVIVTEDSGAGYQFFHHLCKNNGIVCDTASGKSNVYKKALEYQEAAPVLLIADGAAFGSEMEKVTSLQEYRKKIYLYLPESFEWLILNSDIMKQAEVKAILDRPFDYIESSQFMSWEQFFTALLVYETKDTYLVYAKNNLNKNYLNSEIKDKILKSEGISHIGFEK